MRKQLGIQQQVSLLGKTAPYTSTLPLSRSCEISKQIAASRNITHSSRYNDMSILASEVEAITHIPSRREIVITYRGKFCTKPYVIGRLSGLEVALVANWTKVVSSEDGGGVHRLVGKYKVLSGGIYYLEVIGLLCNRLVWDAEYRNVCLENPSYMRLTDDSAYIYVDVGTVVDNESSGNNGAANDIGHWKWRTSNDQFNTFTPLHTRYQPEGCRANENQLEDRCFFPASLDRFLPYQFSFSQPNFTAHIRDKAVSLSKLSPSTIYCFVGLSHAREMATAVNLWLQQWNITTFVKAISLDAQFPRVVNEQFIQNAIINRKCDKTVIAAGQWSVGKKPPGSKYAKLPPTLFPEYRQEVMDMISTLQKSDIDAKNIFLRSIHYNSLGDVKLSCPPQDWRHPAVIDELNSIIANLTRSAGIQYIDTSHIIGPMWDSAWDFCHYRNDGVSSAEALYVLGKLLLV
jgi:hypothetical protein